MTARLTTKQFWTRLEAIERQAELHGSRWEDDTPARRRRRMAEAVVFPRKFGEHYLPHYFRDPWSSLHVVLELAMLFERYVVVRAPRGHGKTTGGGFVRGAQKVACGPVYQAWEDGTLEQDDPELYAEIRAVMAEAIAEWREAGPWTCDGLGLPEHWDPAVHAEMDDWFLDLWRRVCEGPDDDIPMQWDPYIRMIAVTLDTAEEFTAAIRVELEMNPLLRSDWGDLTPCKSGDWAKTTRRPASDADYECNGVRLKAFGTQKAIRGGKHGPYRPSLDLIDDPDSEQTVLTLKQRNRQIKNINSAGKFGLDERKGRRFAVGTAVHGDCVVCRLSEQDQYKRRWTSLRMRARDEDGTILDPNKWDHQRLDEEQLEDEEAYGSELDDRPPQQEGNPFESPGKYSREQYAKVRLPKVLFHDPSYGLTKKSDFQATVALRGPTPDGKILVHRYEQTRIGDPEQATDNVNAIYEEENPDAAGIEAIALGLMVEALATSRGTRQGLFPSWIRVTSHAESKDLRIRGIAPLWNRHIILFPDDESCRKLELQGRTYGEGGSKVDGLDALAEAIKLLRQHGSRQRHGGAGIRHRPRKAAFGKGAW